MPIRQHLSFNGSGRVGVRALVGLAALLLCQLPGVPPTNFDGLDEWLQLELTSRGVVSVPYAYRPLGLAWSLPASLLAPAFGFAAFRVFYAIYALLSAALVFGIARRLLPSLPLLAMLTACFVIVWAPHDQARLSTVESATYQGITFGVLLAAALLVEGWRRRSFPLLSLSALAAFLSIRTYEGGLPLLAAVPALLLLTQERCRRFWRWSFVWWSALAVALGFYLLEMRVSLRQSSYQLSVLGLHPDPAGWLERMARQYSYHLLPLFISPPLELLTPAVPIAVLVFVLALAFFGERPTTPPRDRRTLAIATAVGLGLAGLGYSLVLVGVTYQTAFRLQMLSGPGIAVALASAIHLIGSRLRGRGGLVAVSLMGAWVVATGTGRTVAMQAEWRSHGLGPPQTRMLSGLVRAVPNVAPHTLLVALDDGGAWPVSFSFHHAVQYLYARRAAGFVPGCPPDSLYAVAPMPDGIHFEPASIVRRAWDAPRTLYRYDELVVVRHTGGGEVSLLDTWPRDLTPLPPGAVYAPGNRIAAGPLPRAAILAH